ncbi:type III-B CRISPR module RAMP protein Cmr4 [Thalassoglobus polymorphus]|uniref:RAMP superfamily protein n=1 Tax=Thalassoglobus polymorphus TaxID=2527994 RepID=A0A517QHN6_9PLAN|nr:type III-B CRISPR module RAMP protein Cmr4 [Thalassoglobus polymorphus]QDT31141.1 RAMP superfamily protein [Thalassoglobus polymorphus]
MKTMLYGLLAESPIHPGAGQSTGFVDLPVAREAATDYPVIVGSGMKGALLGMARDHDWDESQRNDVFGKHDNAGGLLVSDARLLLLPVRSLTSSYMWLTCPHLIDRYDRDRKRTLDSDDQLQSIVLEDVAEQPPQYLGPDVGELFLEERQFARAGDLPDGLIETLIPLFAHDKASARLSKQLVVVSDDSFTWFARYGLPVNARNILNEKNKTSKNLWYEETLPPDSLFYCLLAERSAGALGKVNELFGKRPYIQVGGNETIGHGWFALSAPQEGGTQ